MEQKLKQIVAKIKESWELMTIEDLGEIQGLIGKFSKVKFSVKPAVTSKGIELYRDSEDGFVLTAYSEINGTYRIPHNHGNGWVIYAVVEGVVEMGDYANWIKSSGKTNLIFKNKISLNSGDVKIYYPGDIHDTRCLSESAIILRLTSCDLKIEEIEGRMMRFKILEDH